MSLINEALKKAQRQRNHPASLGEDSGAPMASPGAKHGTPMRAQPVLVLFAGATALIVVSVVLTVYLLTRPDPTPTAPTHARTATPASANLDTPSPIIVAPPLAPPPAPVDLAPTPKHETGPAGLATAIVSSATTVKTTAGSPAAGSTASVPSASIDSSATETSSRPLTAASTVKDEVAVQAFVDAIRVTGIRSSGNESKVLMNDRVYRVNDIVERALGLKLIKVSSDALTFADPSGAVYVKNF